MDPRTCKGLFYLIAGIAAVGCSSQSEPLPYYTTGYPDTYKTPTPSQGGSTSGGDDRTPINTPPWVVPDAGAPESDVSEPADSGDDSDPVNTPPKVPISPSEQDGEGTDDAGDSTGGDDGTGSDGGETLDTGDSADGDHEDNDGNGDDGGGDDTGSDDGGIFPPVLPPLKQCFIPQQTLTDPPIPVGAPADTPTKARMINQPVTPVCGYEDVWSQGRVGLLHQIALDATPWCGACLKVTGPLGSTLVRVADSCKKCAPGQIGLSEDAFMEIANNEPPEGLPVTWDLVSCPSEAPMAYHFKQGSGAGWAAVQVRNARNPVVTLEFSSNGLSWQKTKFQTWNYFVAEGGMGTGEMAFRVTDIFGNQVTEPHIQFTEAGEVQGTVQLPPCP